MIEGATWFGPAHRRRFGWLSTPDGGRCSFGVVLCPPFAEESRNAHRTFRTLGAELAARGGCVLRVDYDGTGDSVGAQHDPGRVEAWRASIVDAVNEVRAMGVERIVLVGMRLGATFAAQVAAARGTVEAVVLWDPCNGGRNFLREGQLLVGVGDYTTAQPSDGAADVPGFRYDAATVRDLQDVQLATLPEHAWAERVLVLTRDGEPLGGRAARGFGGVAVRWSAAHGQRELLDVEPAMSRVPQAAVAEIVDWVAGAYGDADRVAITRSAVDECVFEHGPERLLIRERIQAIGPARLFGIVTEPAGQPKGPGPWVVLVNVATEVHVGPGRRWVDFARAWAALGFRCLRVDQSGVGDSPNRDGQPDDITYHPGWLDDLPEVVDQLGSDSAPVTVFGLCSGAYSGLEAALRRPVAAVYAINPSVATPEMSKIGQVYTRERRFARPKTAPFVRLGRRYELTSGALWRIYRQLAFWHAPMSAMLPVLRRGTEVRVIANPKDTIGFREVLWWSIVRRRAVSRTKRLQLATVPEVDHSLLSQAGQDAVFADATRYLTGRRPGSVAPLRP